MTTTSRAPLISVVIVSWNTADETVRCVTSILEHDADGLVEVIVVDNDSADDTVARLREFDSRVRVVQNAANEGFARGCNQGMSLSEAPFIVLINSDTIVHDEVILRSADWLEDHPVVGMVGCEVRNEEGRRTYTAMRRLGVRRSLLENLWLYRLLPSRARALALLGGYWNGDDEVRVDWLVGAFICLRRSVFEQSGGFDVRFFMYGEDSEWGMRLTRMGVRLVYAPGLGVVIHKGATSSRDLWTEHERLRRGHEGGLQAYAMLNGDARAQLFRIARLVGYAVRWAVYAVMSTLRPSDYYRSQRRTYRWLVAFYPRLARHP